MIIFLTGVAIGLMPLVLLLAYSAARVAKKEGDDGLNSVQSVSEQITVIKNGKRC